MSPSKKQELAISQALMVKPQILILDEATSTIENEKKLMSNLLKICTEKGITLISVGKYKQGLRTRGTGNKKWS